MPSDTMPDTLADPAIQPMLSAADVPDPYGCEDDPPLCRECDGTGLKLAIMRHPAAREGDTYVPCDRCNGTGKE